MLCRRLLPVVGIAPLHRSVDNREVLLVRVFRLEVQTGHLCAEQSFRQVVGIPVALAARLSVLVDIVEVAEGREHRVVVEVHAEEPPQVAVFRTQASLGVGQDVAVELAFQVDVHHIVFLLYVAADTFAQPGRLVVYLQVLHRIVGQVVEHELVLAAEEVLSVQEQVVDALSVDVDVAVLLQLGTRELSYQSVEHRTFGQVEGSGIVDDGVAAILYLHLGARNDHAVEVYLLVDVATALHQQSRHLEPFVAAYLRQLVGCPEVVVAFEGGMEEVSLLTSRHLEEGIRAVHPVPDGATDGVYHGRVGPHQRDVSCQGHLRERVVGR